MPGQLRQLTGEHFAALCEKGILGLHQVHGHWEHNRVGTIASNFAKGMHVAQLQGWELDGWRLEE